MQKSTFLIALLIHCFFVIQSQNNYSKDFTNYYSVDTIISLKGVISTKLELFEPVLYQNDSLVMICQIDDNENNLNCVVINKKDFSLQQYSIKIPSLKIMLASSYRLRATAYDGKLLFLNFENNLLLYKKKSNEFRLVKSRNDFSGFDKMYLNDNKLLCVVDNQESSYCQIISTKNLKPLIIKANVSPFPHFYNNIKPKNKFSMYGDELLCSSTVNPYFLVYNSNTLAIVDSCKYVLEDCQFMPDSFSKYLESANQQEFLQKMISGDLKKFIRIVGISKVDSTKIIVFYFVKKTFTPSPYAAILVKEGTKWVTKMQDINLVMSDQTVPISKDYFPTDYFVFDLSTVGNQFAKLLVYPTGKLNFGIPNAEHLSNFSIHDNLSMYIILGKFKINY